MVFFRRLGKLGRRLSGLKVPLYAANAGFFLLAGAVPAMVLMLGLLEKAGMEPQRLGALAAGMLPQAFQAGAESWIRSLDTSGPVLGASAVTLLWSASRGMYAVITGLNAVYAVGEEKGYVFIRLLSVGYTFAFALMLVLTLGLHMLGQWLLELARTGPLILLVDGRFWLLLILQTGIFTGMYMALPYGGNGFFESLPGAVVASIGWRIFSEVYSRYLLGFGKTGTLAVGMVWLYFCMSIFFYGGALNRLIKKGKCL